MNTAASPMPQHAPMPQLQVIDGQLQIGGLSLTHFAGQLGRTPFYVYDRKLVQQRIADVRATLPPEIKLHYSMKANPMPELVSFMSRLVDGIDVASGGELGVALDAGTSPEAISFAGPGKQLTELRQAVSSGILINIESFREVELLAGIEKELGKRARIAVRINPNFELKGSGMKMGGGPKPFGIDAEQVPAQLARIAKLQLDLEGFHLYTGSQCLNAESICEALRQSYELAVAMAAHAPQAIKHVNLGGGFGIPLFPGDRHLDLSPIGNTLAQLVARAATELPNAELVIELGRYLVGEAGIYVARVVDRKVSRGQVFLVLDGGLNHHLAASGNFGQVIRKNYPVAIGNRMADTMLETASIVGPLCTPLDLLADRIELPIAQPGDLVVIFQSGAYGASASPQRFLGHPEVLEVLI